MALRGVTASLDPLTLTEWRNRVATKFGTTYANLASAWQNEVNRLIDEAHDWVSDKFGHEPWARRVWTVGGSDFTAPSTSTGLFELPADCRHIITIQESESGTGAVGRITRMEEWMRVGANTTAHPWDKDDEPRYFFKAMSDDNPPVQTWQRVPTPSTAITAMTILGRGIFDLLGESGTQQYTELPGYVSEEIWHRIAAKALAFRNEYDKAGIELQLAEQAVRDTQINDAPDGAEVLIRPEPPAEFYDELDI